MARPSSGLTKTTHKPPIEGRLTDRELRWLMATPEEMFEAQFEAATFLRKYDYESSPRSLLFREYAMGCLWQKSPLYGYCMDELIGGPWEC